MNTQRGLTIDAFWDSSFWEFLTAITQVAGGALIGLGTALFLSWRNNRRADVVYERDRRSAKEDAKVEHDRADELRWIADIRQMGIETLAASNEALSAGRWIAQSRLKVVDGPIPDEHDSLVRLVGQLERLSNTRAAMMIYAPDTLYVSAERLGDAAHALLDAKPETVDELSDAVGSAQGKFISTIREILHIDKAGTSMWEASSR
ncbi:hypothetical protein [Rathayibacter sp. AY1C4]|uniref:hypothetical protein n=1 Tax=Rathayibacter sp. AY1C4 TaxID=2080537 RepID=UPI0011B05F42|nr:hypothetical protein [Rathayibacter sp. AY1C4]